MNQSQQAPVDICFTAKFPKSNNIEISELNALAQIVKIPTNDRKSLPHALYQPKIHREEFLSHIPIHR